MRHDRENEDEKTLNLGLTQFVS